MNDNEKAKNKVTAWKSSIFAKTKIEQDLRRNNTVRDIYYEGFDDGYDKGFDDGLKADGSANTIDWNPQERHACGDCGVLEGEFHESGCDMEKCPFCLGQLISCDCVYKEFYPEFDQSKPMSGLPKDVYENGLPDDIAEKWDAGLKEKGLIPWVQSPIICARCGTLWPVLFMADDWTTVIPANLQNEVLCGDCYDTVKSFMLAAISST